MLREWVFWVTGLVLGIGVAAALFAPLGYEVRHQAVVIRRLAWNVVIALDTIREAGRVRCEETGFVWRLWGCGGFLGWFGLFRNRGLGEFWAYVGSRRDWVLLTQVDGTKVVLSPDSPDAFLDAVQKAGESKHVGC